MREASSKPASLVEAPRTNQSTPFVWHNVAELLPVGPRVSRAQRVPEPVRNHLSQRGQTQMLASAGVEARTVIEEGEAMLVVSAPDSSPGQPCEAREWRGGFQTDGRWLVGRAPTELTLRAEPPPPSALLHDRTAGGFSSAVRRLCFSETGTLLVHDLRPSPDLRARPPHTHELPRLTMLAYGTSVTQGKAATQPHLTFASQCAARLGIDAINLGCAGSAHCEPTLADHIAQRTDWHLAVLGLSLNMMWMGEAEFRDRIAGFIDRVAGADTRRLVYCITLWPHAYDFGVCLRRDPSKTDVSERASNSQRMREHLREAVRQSPHPNVRCLEGPQLLRSITGLSSDLLHPSDAGMSEIATRLAAELQPEVDRLHASQAPPR